MNKLNIRIKFCITIGVAIFLFSMVSNIAFFNVLKDGMENARTKLEDNVAYINDQYATESEEETPHPSLSGNMYKETKEDIMIDRSSETYQAALNILNETFQDTIAKTFIWSLMLGLIGFILSYPLSGLLLKPFKELTSDIANINEGNLDKQLYITNRHDEIGKIKIAFNRLLVRLDTILERQSNFTSNVAHELKTPLAVMKMYPETLDEESTIEDYKKVIEVEKKNVDRMSALVDDLLAYSRDIDIKATIVSIKDVIDKCLDDMKPLIDQKHITVHLDIVDEDVVTSKELLSRLIYNILSNATRYNKEKGSIYIEYKAKELSIRDTGIGIPEDKLEHIFEPLYCVDKSRSRELGGSGIGLAMVKRIADTLGYKIEVSSKVDRGTVFTIRL